MGQEEAKPGGAREVKHWQVSVGPPACQCIFYAPNGTAGLGEGDWYRNGAIELKGMAIASCIFFAVLWMVRIKLDCWLVLIFELGQRLLEKDLGCMNSSAESDQR